MLNISILANYLEPQAGRPLSHNTPVNWQLNRSQHTKTYYSRKITHYLLKHKMNVLPVTHLTAINTALSITTQRKQASDQYHLTHHISIIIIVFWNIFHPSICSIVYSTPIFTCLWKNQYRMHWRSETK